jgi:hypothetical protein
MLSRSSSIQDGSLTRPRICAAIRARVCAGPFAQRGLELAEGNAKFDAMLKQRELGWKLREVEWLDELADGHAMTKVAMVAMPSDNWTIIYAAPPAARQ